MFCPRDYFTAGVVVFQSSLRPSLVFRGIMSQILVDSEEGVALRKHFKEAPITRRDAGE